jgi:hypothetical protein
MYNMLENDNFENWESRWDDNIKMDLTETGYKDGRWIELVQDRVQRRALGISGVEP